MANNKNVYERIPLLSSSPPCSSPAITTIQQLYAQFPVPGGSRSIRLLQLNALPPDRDEAPLTGHMSVARLADRPQFTTLSYVWGLKTPPSPVLTVCPQGCSQGIDLEITANCFNALRQIRRRFGAVTIWIDAVCINQGDRIEKESQIPLMQTIYSSARTGYIWLGARDGSPELDRAVKCLKLRATVSLRLPLDYLRATSRQTRAQELASYTRNLWRDAISRWRNKNKLFKLMPQGPSKLLSGPHERHRLLHTAGQDLVRIQELLHSPWISRAWTFQELVLSENPVLLCGDKRIQWQDIINAVTIADVTPSMNMALTPWRSLVGIWFALSRPSLRRCSGNDEEALPPGPSFGKLLDEYRASWRILDPEFTFLPARFIFGAIVTFALPALVLGISYIAYSSKGRHPPDENDQPKPNPVATAFQTLAICLLPILLLTRLLWLWVGWFAEFICFGSWHTDRELCMGIQTTGKNHNLPSPFPSAIWTALRERACSDPRDKAFSLFGILTEMGISPSPPDYSRPVRDVYLFLFRDLVASDSAFVTLLLSAGAWNQEPGWPSWLPNWNVAEHNAWLVDRCRLNQAAYRTRIRATNVQPPIISVSEATITLQGISMGALLVKSLFRFTAITASDTRDDGRLVSTLGLLDDWIQSVQNKTEACHRYHRHLPSAFFATLHGLFPPATHAIERGPRLLDLPGIVPSSQGPWVERPEWEAPYDFTGYVDLFHAFRGLLDIVNDRKLYTRAAKLSRLRTDERAFKYFVDVVNKLVDEDRCLFVLPSGMGGSAPCEVVEGDEVFALPQVRAPVVLRRVEGVTEGFVLVAPALVPGLMYGECFEEGSEEELQTLVLR